MSWTQSSQIMWRFFITCFCSMLGDTKACLPRNKSVADMRKLISLLGSCPPTTEKIFISCSLFMSLNVETQQFFAFWDEVKKHGGPKPKSRLFYTFSPTLKRWGRETVKWVTTKINFITVCPDRPAALYIRCSLRVDGDALYEHR